MSIRSAMFSALCATAGLVVAVPLAFADGDGLVVEDIAPTPDMIVTTPSTDRLIKDGDESVVDTVMVYLDGCPLLSLTPGAVEGSPPTVVMLDRTEGCVPADGSAPEVSPAALWASGANIADNGLFVQVHRDGADGSDPGSAVPVAFQGPTLVIDIADLSRKPVFADGSAGGPTVSGPVPPFYIPAVINGTPVAGLIPASTGPGGSFPGSFGSGGGGGGSGRPNGGSSGGNGSGPGGSGGSSTGPGAGGSGGGGFAPGGHGGPGGGGNLPAYVGPVPGGGTVPAIPLPATLVLMSGALIALYRVARRR